MMKWVKLITVLALMVGVSLYAQTSSTDLGIQANHNAFTPKGGTIASVSNVALFQEWDPWGYTAIKDILDSHGISYTVYGQADIGVVDLSPYDKVITSSQQSYSFYQTLSANASWLENYVLAGGCLEMHFATWVDYDPSGLTFPFGITLLHVPSIPDEYQDVDRAMPAHDIFNVPNPVDDNELDNWNFSSHGYFTSYPGNTDILAVNVEDQTPCLIEVTSGGHLVATLQPVEWAWASGYSDILENMILYCPGPTDVEETGISATKNSLNVTPSLVRNNAEISFSLQKEKEVTVTVYDVSGKAVEVLANGKMSPGTHTLSWSPTELNSGVYFVNVAGNGLNLTTKVLVAK